jgi:peptidoglycan/xylan/chitin deacetylase (PgdA/CDA1 family)
LRGGFKPLVLCYHAVSETWPHALSLPLADLERQLRLLLRAGYRPATAAEALAGRGRLLHVTFDDAFRSLALALPLLDRLGLPVTVFACPAYADGGRALDVAELARDAAVYQRELQTMGWDELRGLAERGVEVGSHTLTHPHLTRLGDAELREELTESKGRLETELGRPCPLLAYPFGEEDARARRAARGAGYTAAFALPGRRRPVDLYALSRVGVYRDEGLVRATIKVARGR